jgi:hypothetical protein
MSFIYVVIDNYEEHSIDQLERHLSNMADQQLREILAPRCRSFCYFDVL